MKIQLTGGRKQFSQRQSKVLDPGRLQSTTIQQQDNKASGKQHNIWDTRGL